MNIKTNLSNKANYGGERSTSNIKYLVYHYTANDGDTDEANGNYFKNNIVKASAHYFVDDDSVTQSVPDNYVAWSVGGSKYPNTKGGTFHGICTNSNSISIEMCDCERNGYYNFTPATLNNAIELGKEIMKKYNIPIDRVIRHYDVTGKICPKPFVDNEQAWKDFKARLANDEGWKNRGWGWWYQYKDGSYPHDKWEEIGGYWFYFDSNGYAVTGWKYIDGKWYYFDENCYMRTGWRYIDKKWYYLDKTGALVTNAYIQSASQKNYYHWVNAKGEWVKESDSWDITKYKHLEV